MKRTVSRVAVTLGAITVMTAGLATANISLAAAASCPSTQVCVFSDANYTGTILAKSGNVNNYTNYSPGTCNKTSFSDCASSVINAGTQCTVYLWTSINYTGRYHSVAKGDWVANFASSTTGFKDPSFNDTVSSHHWCTPS